MERDILFWEEDFIFSYRVAGILVHNEKILLQKPKDEAYSLIGGHIKCMETAEETLKREFKEEIKADIEIDNLMAVGEIFFPWGKKPCHQISLYYKVYLNDIDSFPIDGSFQGYDDFGNRREDIEFCWVPLSELRNGLIVYPTELIPYILEDRKGTVHFVSRQV